MKREGEHFGNPVHIRLLYLREYGAWSFEQLRTELARVVERRKQVFERGDLTPKRAEFFALWISDLQRMNRYGG